MKSVPIIKITFILLAFVIYAELVSAAATTDAHGWSFPSTTTPSDMNGEVINVSESRVLGEVMLVFGQQGASCILQHNNNGSNISVVARDGQLCNFTSANYKLVPGLNYSIALTNNGASYTLYYGTTVSYPKVNTYVTWIGRCYSSTTAKCTYVAQDLVVAISNITTYDPPSPISFVGPTPANASHNNTQQNINITCSSGNITLWFDSNVNPTTRVINNKSSPANYTTSLVSDGAYYYRASCDSGTTNSSTMVFYYDTTNPAITLNSSNFFVAANTSKATRLQVNKWLNFTLTDNIDLYGYEINITNKTNQQLFYNSSESLSGTSWNVVQYVNFTNWSLGNYTVKILVSDSHNALAKGYDVPENLPLYDVEKPQRNKVVFETIEGNHIEMYSNDDMEITPTRTGDKYEIGIRYNEPLATKTQYLYSPEKITYKSKTPWKGHFVIGKVGSANYVDYENSKDAPITVTKINDHLYQIDTQTSDDTLTYHSIGGLNTYEIHYRFEIVSSYPFNSRIYLGDYLQWTYSGELTTMQNVSMNITQANLILSAGCICSGCIDDGDYCRIPVKLYSEANSTIQARVYNVSVDYGIDNCSNSYAIPSNATAANYTIKDEVNESLVNADIDALFTYEGGTFSYEADDTNNFKMCIYPSWGTLPVDSDIDYSSGTQYPQRTYTQDDESWSSGIYQKTLYLLESTSGIYARFKIVDSYDDPISGVTSQMSYGGSVVEIEVSDGAGLSTFWVNPDVTYDFTFSKTGYTSYSVSLRPTSAEVYTITLASESEQAQTYSTQVSYNFEPYIVQLANDTSYAFNFTLSSYYWNITDCDFFIKDTSDNTLKSVAGTYNLSNCNATIIMNTGRNTTIYAYGIYELNGTEITKSRGYSIQIGDYATEGTLKMLLDDLKNFSGSGFDDETRLLLAFIITFAIVAYVTYKFNGLVNQEVSIITTWVCVLFFSYIDWLSLNIPNLPTGIGGLTNQWLIFILITLIASAYISWRHSQ